MLGEHRFDAVRKWVCMIVGLVGMVLVSCDSPEETEVEKSKEKSSPAKSTPRKEVAEEKPKEPAFPPLSKIELGNVERISALVRIQGHTDRAGVIASGGTSSSGARSYLVICEAPSDAKTVAVAYYPNSRGFDTARAERISVLPSGLSVYRFNSTRSMASIGFADPVEGLPFRAIRLSEVGEAGPEKSAEIEEELGRIDEAVRDAEGQRRARMEEYARMRRENPRQRPNFDQYRGGSDMHQQQDLRRRREEIRVKQLFTCLTVEAEEVAASKDRNDFGADEKHLENSILVSSGSSIHAIRVDGKWVDIKQELEIASGAIEELKLDLYGSRQNVSLSCSINHFLPFGEFGYSLVAASTFELESIGSGSVEERLAAVKPVPFTGSGQRLSISHQISWNGQPSNIWVRIFKDGEPDKPVIDEVIRVSYHDNFFAKWDKPPSPLITIPEPPPNLPENLVTAQRHIDAKGEILDLIAAGDGSVVMVRTDAAPYWAQLDLKSGNFITSEWTATPDTLLAAQAGKLYLLDAKTRVMEIRDLATGKREGLQILSYEGSAVAFGAPLQNPDKPVMVVSEKGAFLFDSTGFDPVSSGIDVDRYFNPDEKISRNTLMDPASISVRVSGDGALYSIRGEGVGTSQSGRPVGTTVTLDSSSLVTPSQGSSPYIASKGRLRTSNFPDHGGSALTLSAKATGNRFPGAAGTIRFSESRGQALAELADPPVLPQMPGKFFGKLADDRGCYFDSEVGVLLLPDGTGLHYLKLDLPKVEKDLPEFVFTGEKVELPLPAGTGHTFTSSGGGDFTIEGDVVRWTAPRPTSSSTMNLKLEWQGELGTKMEESYRMQVVGGTGLAEVVSPGGKKLPLHLRGILPDGRRKIDGLAGSGHVGWSKDSSKISVYNLATCEKLHEAEIGYSDTILGDADHIYVLADGKKIRSLDITTGRVLAEKQLAGNPRSIATGMASRLPLLAVEQEGVTATLLMIDRISLESRIVELDTDMRQRLFIPRLASNASGSAMWTRGVSIFRDGKAITVTAHHRDNFGIIHGGVPDATGKLVLDAKSVFDITRNPPGQDKAVEDEDGSMDVGFDESGRYVMVSPRGVRQGEEHYISIRTVAAPDKELFRIVAGSRIQDGFPILVSGTGTLLCRQSCSGSTRNFVYDFDIPAIINELSR